MAEGGSVNSFTTVRGSDEAFLYTSTCDSCKYDGTIAEGIGFCEVCQEFLCDSCLRVHKKTKALRSHKLLEGSDIHKARKNEPPSLAVQYCKTHRDKEVYLYCQYHDEVICDLCRTIDHRKCPDVKSIADICDGPEAGPSVTNVLDNSRSLLEKFKSLEREQRGDLTGLERQKEECLQKIKTLRSELMKRLDEVEKELRQKMDDFIAVKTKTISDTLSTLDSVTKAIENETNQLQIARESGDIKLAFIATKNIDLKKLEEVYSDIEKENKDIKIDFISESLTDDILDTGRLHVRWELKLIARPKVPVIMNDAKDKTMTKIGEHYVKFDDDKDTCHISGSTFLPGGELLMCDCVNKKLKLTDELMCVKSSVKLSAEPWDVALLGDREAVVTKPDQQKIQFVTVAPRLQLRRNVDVGLQCWGIACSKDRIYVTCHDDPGIPEVLVLDSKGAIHIRITNTEGARPDYIAVDDAERIFLSDYETDTVTCMNISGQTEYTYKDTDLEGPTQLLIDANQFVYICCEDSNTVQVITDKGVKYKTLLTSKDRVVEPTSLAFRASDGTLALGKEANRIFCFKYV